MTDDASPTLIFGDGLERPVEGDLTIGRDRVCEVVLSSKTVSRRHARLVLDNGMWFLEDLGSANGTLVNDHRVPSRTSVRLRHGDRIQIGSERFRYSRPSELQDEDRTESEEAVSPRVRPESRLSPLQAQVVRVLCEEWVASGSLERVPTNDEIADRLGTPGATGTVKAALRRAYAKAGLSDLPSQAKRRALCRVAHERGWI